MSVPDDIAPSEMLGRAVFDASKARAAEKGKVPPKVFRERLGILELSVDRLSLADKQSLVKTHESARENQQFYGWAVVDHKTACDMDRTVGSDKLPENEWHANILLPELPDGAEAQDELQKAHSLNLARRSKWQTAESALSGE